MNGGVGRRFWLFLYHPAVAWGLLTLYAGLIFAISSKPIGGEVELFPQLDKLIHAVEYGFFGVMAYHAMRVSRPSVRARHNFLIAIMLGVAYGASDEFHQYFVPTREVSYADLVADAIGVVIGAWLLARQEWSRGRMKHANR